jgi:V/A-type H+-transporting ATPase subunit D
MVTESAPTRAAVLELRAEQLIVEESYEFLDEKRLLLAAELLRQLNHYERLITELEEKRKNAYQLLVAAVQRHGLQGLGVYPASSLEGIRMETSRRNLMGVSLQETAWQEPESPLPESWMASNPSLEAERCRAAFREIVRLGAVLAGVSGNLHRLSVEYRLTERRARALENIILPEIEYALVRMNAYLEEQDMEDAIRARPLAKPYGEKP